MAKFSIDSLLNNNSKSLAVENPFEVTNIPYEDLIPNELNKYNLSDLETLAESIKAYGLKQNLEVKPAPTQPGKYIIMTGHRRYAAIGLVRKETPDLFKYIPCTITTVQSQSDEIIQMVITNSTAREMTDAEKLNQYVMLRDAVEQRIKETGEGVGNKRKFFANALKVSETQIQRYRDVSDKLIPELQQEIQDGELSLQKAAEIAAKPQEKQKSIHQILEKEKKEPAPAPVVIPIPTKNDTKAPEEKADKTQAQAPTEPQKNKPAPKYTVARTDFDFSRKALNHLKDVYIAAPTVEVDLKKKETIEKEIVRVNKALAKIFKLLGSPLN